jgi:hypothetical protein
MSVDSWWRRLLHELRTLGTVKAGDGLITLFPDRPGGGPREIVIVMTLDEWDETVGVMWGRDADGAARQVGRTVRELRPEQRFLIYRTYDLVPSETPKLPRNAGLVALEAHFAEHPEDRGKGGWYAHPLGTDGDDEAP